MWTNMKIRNISSLLVLTVIVVGLAGCGGGGEDPFGYVQIEGTVKYDDGTLLQGDRISVTFKPLSEPIDAKTHPPMGFAEVNVGDGSFSKISSGGYQNGLVPGKHKVTIDVVGGKIPKQYSNSDLTPLEIDTDNPPFDLRISKE